MCDNPRPQLRCTHRLSTPIAWIITCTSRMPPKTPISHEKKAKATAYAAAMEAERPSLMESMESVPGRKKHKRRSVSFASQAEVRTLLPKGGHQVLTSAPISTPKHESQSAKPDPKPDPKPNPCKPSDQSVAAEAIPDPEAEVMVRKTKGFRKQPQIWTCRIQASSPPKLPLHQSSPPLLPLLL